MKSWRTSLGGFLVLFGTVAADIGHLLTGGVVDITTLLANLAAIGAVFGLFAAKDHSD